MCRRPRFAVFGLCHITGLLLTVTVNGNFETNLLYTKT